jgi:hypothetical protein
MRSRNSKLVALAIALTLGSGTLVSPGAQAMDRDVRSVLVAGGYGLVTGTVLGLATTPFSHNPRTIFVGSSVGLYMGLALGIYYVVNRDSPDNPLRRGYGLSEGSPEGHLQRLAGVRAPSLWEGASAAHEPAQVSWSFSAF